MTKDVKREWPDPTAEMLETPEFNAVWQVIKAWDINVPEAYEGYCGATGNHVRAVLDALNSFTRRPPHGRGRHGIRCGFALIEGENKGVGDALEGAHQRSVTTEGK
jgi:hypothetical protein